MYGMRRNVNYSSVNPPSAVVSNGDMTSDGALNPLSCTSIISLLGFAVVPLIIWFALFHSSIECPNKFDGGTPYQHDTCFCSDVDKYCLCTPTVIIEGVLEYRTSGDTESDPDCLNCQFVARETVQYPEIHAYTLPNSHLYVGSTPEHALNKNLNFYNNMSFINPQQVKMYSDLHPYNLISMVYSGQAVNPQYSTKSRLGTIALLYFKDILSLNLRDEHKTIVKDYIKQKYPVLWKQISHGKHHVTLTEASPTKE